MKIASAFLCEEDDVTDGRLVDVGITSVSTPSYPAPLRKPLVLIVVLETADIDKEFEIYVGSKTGDVTTFGWVVDLKNFAYSARPTEMPAWHVRKFLRTNCRFLHLALTPSCLSMTASSFTESGYGQS
jgi:hypothetical protein